jgi:hypothetical protein
MAKKLENLNIPLTSAKVIEVFQSPYTEQLNDRKADMIIKFCDQRRDGFFFEELPDLIKMIKYSLENFKDGVQEMENSILSILQIIALPLKKNKASDELKYAGLLPEILISLK